MCAMVCISLQLAEKPCTARVLDDQEARAALPPPFPTCGLQEASLKEAMAARTESQARIHH